MSKWIEFLESNGDFFPAYKIAMSSKATYNSAVFRHDLIATILDNVTIGSNDSYELEHVTATPQALLNNKTYNEYSRLLSRGATKSLAEFTKGRLPNEGGTRNESFLYELGSFLWYVKYIKPGETARISMSWISTDWDPETGSCLHAKFDYKNKKLTIKTKSHRALVRRHLEKVKQALIALIERL